MIPRLIVLPRGQKYDGLCSQGMCLGKGWEIPHHFLKSNDEVTVDAVRDLIRDSSLSRPTFFEYVICGVESLQTVALEMLLKTLEEPPTHAFFTLITSNEKSVPTTLLSRCMVIYPESRYLHESENVPLHRCLDNMMLIKDREQLLNLCSRYCFTPRQKKSFLTIMSLHGYRFSPSPYWALCGLNIDSRL